MASCFVASLVLAFLVGSARPLDRSVDDAPSDLASEGGEPVQQIKCYLSTSAPSGGPQRAELLIDATRLDPVDGGLAATSQSVLGTSVLTVTYFRPAGASPDSAQVDIALSQGAEGPKVVATYDRQQLERTHRTRQEHSTSKGFTGQIALGDPIDDAVSVACEAVY